MQDLSVRVWRGAAEGRFQTFQVPRRAHQTILDVVTEIQRDQDATLSYRFACRVGMCGSCAMVVNGRPRWTCRTRVSEAVGSDGELRLEPLRNMTVVKDLEGEGHAILTIKTDRGEFILDNLTDDIRPWNATGYTYIKRQAQDDPNVWLDLGGVRGLPQTAQALAN